MNYIIAPIVIVFMLLLTTIYIQHEHNNSLDGVISTYAAEIAQLQADAKAQAQKYQIAQAAADKQMNEAQKQSNSIMKQKVSDDCAQAMVWLVAQRGLI
jgi:F0F1-type ATP synthase membrane subunit b/b'